MQRYQSLCYPPSYIVLQIVFKNYCLFSLFFCKYLVISIVLGVIGVGGLVFQWGSGIIDEFFSIFDDLEARLDALEGATTTGTATTACTCDLTAVTATANAACAKVRPNTHQLELFL